ncbi:unnamed protein product, partial [Symbiodinium sp. CCMP2456]
MFRVLKEICDDKERTKEQEMQVTASARCRTAASCEALQEHMTAFSEELHTSAALVGVDGKIKNPKKKKILTPEQEVDKSTVACFKKILSDEGKLAAHLQDLAKVPHSTELASSLVKHKCEIKNILKDFDSDTKIENPTIETKKAAVNAAQLRMNPILKDMREAVRRIKAEGLTVSKAAGAETDTNSV